MPVKRFKPTSPGIRQMTVSTFEEITEKKPVKALTGPNPQSGGRNRQGRMTSRHRGGAHKRQLRVVDFKRSHDGVPARVVSIQYDPNRSARIALLAYLDGKKSYILAPAGLQPGDRVESGPGSDIRPGNAMELGQMPVGTQVHCIELVPGKGAQMARSAGSSAQLMAKENGMALLRLPSGEQRLVRLNCRATVGQVGNLDHENISLGKAGRSRWLGRRPHVRGVAMNPVDHPHGGGEGKSPIGRPSPVTPWGQPTLGKKTRKRRKPSSRYIVKGRK